MDCAHRSIASAVRGIGGKIIDGNPLRSPGCEEMGDVCCRTRGGGGGGEKRGIIP